MLGSKQGQRTSPAMAALAEGYGVRVEDVEAGSRLPEAKMAGQCATQGAQPVIVLFFLSFQRMFYPQIPPLGVL